MKVLEGATKYSPFAKDNYGHKKGKKGENCVFRMSDFTFLVLFQLGETGIISQLVNESVLLKNFHCNCIDLVVDFVVKSNENVILVIIFVFLWPYFSFIYSAHTLSGKY